MSLALTEKNSFVLSDGKYIIKLKESIVLLCIACKNKYNKYWQFAVFQTGSDSEGVLKGSFEPLFD